MNAYITLVRQHAALITAGILLTFVSSLGQTYFISLFGGQLRATFDLDHAGLGGVYSAATLLSAVCFIWAGRLVDFLSLVRMAMLVCLLLGLSSLLFAFAPNVLVLFLALFGLRLSGQGLATHVALTAMAKRFAAERGKAVSLAMLGIPLGEVVFPLLAVMALVVGRQASWTFFAVFVLVVFVPVFWRLLGRIDTSDIDGSIKRTGSPAPESAGWTRSQVLHDPRFYLLLPGALVPAFVITGLFFHQIHIVEARDWNLTVFASAFSIYAFASVIGSLLGGWLVDRYSARKIFPYFLPVMMLACVVLAVGDGETTAFLLMAGLGFSQGGFSTSLTALWAEFYGTAHLGAIRALITAIMVFGSALSPVILGIAFDAGASVAAVALACAAYAGVGCVLFWPAMRYRADLTFSGRA